MRAQELKRKSPAELAELIRERSLRREELTAAIAQRKVKNVRELRALRRDIARIRTVLRQSSL